MRCHRDPNVQKRRGALCSVETRVRCSAHRINVGTLIASDSGLTIDVTLSAGDPRCDAIRSLTLLAGNARLLISQCSSLCMQNVRWAPHVPR